MRYIKWIGVKIPIVNYNIKTNMQIIKARYKGSHLSLEYRTNYEYLLVFKENPLTWFFPKPLVEIWRTTNRFNEHSNGYCPYSSMHTFLENWEVIEIC